MLRRRGWITAAAVLALAGLVAAMLTYLVPLAFAATPAPSGHGAGVDAPRSGGSVGTAAAPPVGPVGPGATG